MSPRPISLSIAHLKAQLETHLGWGDSETWTPYDFEQLSERILQQTGTSLSVSTLRRILGKVANRHAPSLTTLNTLSQFLGYSDWRSFQSTITEPALTPVKLATSDKATRIPPGPVRWLGGGLASLLLIGLGSVFFPFSKSGYRSSDFRFTANKILTQGLPNSVVFHFDATQAHPEDSVFICQSWDIRRKTLVDKHDTHHSAIYYYPGFYQAKLLIGGQVLRQQAIQINTDGWLGLIEADWGQEPLYFSAGEIVGPQSVRITGELLRKYEVKRGPSASKIVLVNQKTIQGIKTDAFDFETEVKSMTSSGADACQRIEVVLQAKNDLLIVPLVEPGCIGDIYIAAYGHYAPSRKADLSGFGCDPTQWTRLKVSCRKGVISFFVNQKAVYQARIKSRPSDIIGVQIRYNGPGAVRHTWLQGATNKVVF